MTLIENIVRELPHLPQQKLVEVARLVHSSTAHAQKERARILAETHGCLDEHDGEVFEAALKSARRSVPAALAAL